MRRKLENTLKRCSCKLLVARIIQTRCTPFKDGIPGKGWMKWFHHRHPNLALQTVEGLDLARARNLCPDGVQSFYQNLVEMYQQHKYDTSHVWNCNETGVQAGRQRSAQVLAKKGIRSVVNILPDEKEWMSILACINAAGESIPSFYIFRGKRFQRNSTVG